MSLPEGIMYATPRVWAVLGLYEAMRDRRLEDLLARIDQDVVCYPVERPGLSVYHGHAGMVRLVHDMHAAYGEYQVEIDEITEHDEPAVTVRATILPELARGMPPVPVTTRYTFRAGLVTLIDSTLGHVAP